MTCRSIRVISVGVLSIGLAGEAQAACVWGGNAAQYVTCGVP